MKNPKFLFFLFLILAISGFSQKNTLYDDVLYNYQNALKYYNNEEYLNSYNFFQRVVNQQIPSYNSQIDLFKEESRFYTAILSGRLGMENAESQLLKIYDQVMEVQKKEQIAYNLGCFYFEKGDFSAVETWFEKTTEKWMSAKEIDQMNFKKAYAQMKNNKNEVALLGFKKIIENKKSQYTVDAYYYSGMIFYNSKQFKEAETFFAELKNAKSAKFDISFILGQIHFFNKKYKDVIEVCEPKLTEKNKNHSEMCQLVGKSYFQLADYKNAQKYLDQYISSTQKATSEDMYQLAFSEHKNGDYKSAITHFSDLYLSDEIFTQSAMYSLAECYLKTDDKHNAKIAFISASKYNQDTTIKQECMFNIPKLNYDFSNYNEAIKGFKTFLSTYPKSSNSKEAWYLMTRSLVLSNNYPEAIELIEKNEELQAGNEKLYQELSYVYALNLYNNGKSDSALRYLKKSIKNPFDIGIEIDSRYLKAEILMQLKDYVNALKEYSDALNKYKSNPTANAKTSLVSINYGKAYAAYMNKDYLMATSEYSNTIKLDNDKRQVIEKSMIQDAKLRIADIHFINREYDMALNSYTMIANGEAKGYDYAMLQKATIEGIKKQFKLKIATLNTLINKAKKSIYVDDASFQLGLAYEDDGNMDHAMREYLNLYNKNPHSEIVPKALLRLGTLNYNNNKENEAILYYSKIINEYSSSAEAEQSLKALKEIFIAKNNPEAYVQLLDKLPNAKKMEQSEQDSLIFEAGEEYFASGNCDKAIPYLIKYQEKFPNGIFISKSNYYMAECYFAQKQFESALDNYLAIIDRNDNVFMEKAIVKSAYIAYNVKKDYSKANTLYEKLKAIASTRQNIQISKIGLLNTSYGAKKYKETIVIADEIANDMELSEDIKRDAQYLKIKSMFLINETEDLIKLINAFTEDKNSEKSAELTFVKARFLSNQKEFVASNELLIKAKDEYASYEPWVVRYFILMAENYHKLGDDFQAKATLESIIQNYNGDKRLIDEAKGLLKEVTESAREKSKIKFKK